MDIILEVPFEKKDDAKKLGAKWNMELKKWCCKKDNNECIEKYEPVYLNVPYEDRAVVKSLGAKWNNERKEWYIPRFREREFDEYLDL